VALLDAGAYGFATAAESDSRPPPAEPLVRGGRAGEQDTGRAPPFAGRR
jgi:hypothetical protein